MTRPHAASFCRHLPARALRRRPQPAARPLQVHGAARGRRAHGGLRRRVAGRARAVAAAAVLPAGGRAAGERANITRRRRRRRRGRLQIVNFYWSAGEWSRCSATCQGAQAQSIVCVDALTTKPVADHYCTKVYTSTWRAYLLVTWLFLCTSLSLTYLRGVASPGKQKHVGGGGGRRRPLAACHFHVGMFVAAEPNARRRRSPTRSRVFTSNAPPPCSNGPTSTSECATSTASSSE